MTTDEPSRQDGTWPTDAVGPFVSSWRRRHLDAWYEHFEAGMLLKLVRKEVRVKRVGRSEGEAVEDMVAKARTRDSTRVLAKRADEIDGELRIVADPPVIVPVEDRAR
jgi:hypothetical protein